MPDILGKLSADDSAQAEQWLKKTWKNWRCPVDANRNWEIGGIMAQLPAWSPTRFPGATETFPVLVVMCSTCGYVRLVNAIKAGLVSP